MAWSLPNNQTQILEGLFIVEACTTGCAREIRAGEIPPVDRGERIHPIAAVLRITRPIARAKQADRGGRAERENLNIANQSQEEKRLNTLEAKDLSPKNGVFGAKTKAKLPVRRVRNSVGRQAG
jgi:hypothetical protein